MPTFHFTLAYWCILIAAVLPVVAAATAKFGMFTTPPQKGGYDNDLPREWLSRQKDWRARANAAQANTFEALPFFFAAVIIAHQLQANQARLDTLAVLFIVLRIAYLAVYVRGMARTRSAVWTLAFATNIAILFLGYR